MTSEWVLAWAKRVEVQTTHSEIINSLCETKDFDRIKKVRSEQRQMLKKLHTPTKMPAKQNYSYCGSCLPPRKCLAYGKKCEEYGKINHFKEVSTSKRGRASHNTEQEPNLNQEEVKIHTVNINSTSFNSKWSIITADLKTNSYQSSAKIPYRHRQH